MIQVSQRRVGTRVFPARGAILRVGAVLLAVMVVGAVVLAGLSASRQAYGKPRLSGYTPGRDGSSRLGTMATARVAGAPAAPAAAPAAAAAGGNKTLVNGNYSGVPAAVPADRPYGPPVARTDWVITKDYAAHGGHGNWGALDFAFMHNYQALGAPLVATHAGRVKLLQDDPTYGNLVYVVGPHFTTTYGHMQKFTVKEGDQVTRGTVLGEMGSTGKSTGPHVDYQVWQDGDNKNPMDFGISGVQGAGPMH
ncbi:MAG TPA: M23 family metallopeptidase [Chloroflexia bacterium]|nr:M23 family metallopeptidase [Chloroflexia bacterium]